MKRILLPCILLATCTLATAQISNITFGTDSTLEIVTWNVEKFPKKGSTTINYVKQVIQAIDADIFAFQEVADTTEFINMVNSIGGYSYSFGDYYYTSLAFIYKTSTIQANHIYEIYNSYSYSSPFPRSPFILNFNYADEQIFLIDNHLKCCGDGVLDMDDTSDEEYRRYRACNLLKEYVEGHFENTKVVIVGDMNDEITDAEANNVFKNIINDSTNFKFADMQIAQGASSNWSYPSWPSHLDHILITNELFDTFERDGSSIEVIKVDDYMGSWNTYDYNISDHRPVGLKLYFNKIVNGQDEIMLTTTFTAYPNPTSTNINYTFNRNCDQIAVYNAYGQLVKIIKVENNSNSAQLKVEDMPQGIYFATQMNGSTLLARTKFIILR